MEKQPIHSYQKFSERGFAKVTIYQGSSSTVFVLNLKPGQQMPAHFHPGAELYFLVLEGNGTFTVDGNKIEVSKHDTLHVQGTQKLGFINTGDEPATVYVTLCKKGDEIVGDSC